MSNRNHVLSVLCALIAVALAFGCSGKSGTAVTPSLPMGSAAVTHVDSAGGGHILWGMYGVTIDPATGKVDILPVRNAEFTCNVTLFLQPPSSPINMLGIELINGECDFPNGLVVCNVTLKHPFPGLPMYRGFDVRGLVMGDASGVLSHDPNAIHSVQGELTLLNPDGYARWWNPTEFGPKGTIFGYIPGAFTQKTYMPTATLNGYKYFADELGPDDNLELSPANRGTFSTNPGINTRRYELQFPASGGVPQIQFGYAVDASWNQPDPSGAPDYPISSFPINANCDEPYMVKVTDAGSTAWYVNDNDKGGGVTLDIEVFDWQAPGNPLGVPGELSGLWLEGEILAAPMNILGTATVLPGGPTSSVFEIQIGNPVLTHSGRNEIWVIAENADPNSYEPQIDSDTSPFTWADSPLAAYLRTTVGISDTQFVEYPIVLAIDPVAGEVDSVVHATVTGQKLANGCEVELRQSDTPSPFVIEGQGEIWMNSTEVTCSLDLTGAPLGLYDVVVINPGPMEGSLSKGFQVLAGVELLWRDEGVINHSNRITYNDIDPALVINGSGQVLCTFFWWIGDLSNYTLMPRFAASDDHGATFGSGESGGWGSHGGPRPACENGKYAVAADGYAFQSYNAPCGHTVGATPLFSPYEASLSHSGTGIQHAGEMVYTSEGYPMLFGDNGGAIKMRRGDYPNQGGTGSWPVFVGTEYTLVPGTANWGSFVRSVGKTSDGICHLLFWNNNSLDYIQMISTTDISGIAWGGPVIVFNGLAETWVGASDPSLWIDENDGFHTVFRATDFKNQHRLMYGYSANGMDWNVGSSFTQIEIFPAGQSLNDTGVVVFDAFGTTYVFICYEVGGTVWCRFKTLAGTVFSDPIQVNVHASATLPDLYPNGDVGIVFAYQADDGSGNNLTDVFYRLAEFHEK